MDLRSQYHFISFARFFVKSLEVVSKPQIRFKGKAQVDEKAQHTR
jgi:hypothetical protein